MVFLGWPSASALWELVGTMIHSNPPVNSDVARTV
jgi:hypothetical protein